MKKILINGNMGYIGPVVVNHFRNKYEGIKIIGFDNGYFAGCLVDPNLFPETSVDMQYFGDVRNFPKEVLDGVDAVIQLSAISNDPMGKSFEAPTHDINNSSVIEVAKLSKKMGVKNFVFASSCSVYGAAGLEAKTEESEVNPQTAYAISKIDCEIALKDLADNSFSVTALRFATACGFSPRLRLDLVLNDFVVSGYLKQKIEILSDGTPLRPLIHVKDMALAIDWASNRNPINGDEYLVLNTGSDDWNYQVKDLAFRVKDLIGNIDVSINPNAAFDNRSYRVDFGLFKSLAPEYTPRVSLDQAILELYSGVQKMKFQNSDFRNSHFIRLKTLNTLIEGNYLNNQLKWIK